MSLAVLLGFIAPGPALADSITVSSAANEVSGSQWEYISTLSGSLSSGDLLAIYFPAATSATLVNASSTGPAFTTSVLQPDSSIPADGEYDLLANAAESTFSGTLRALSSTLEPERPKRKGALASQGDYIRVDGPRVWIEFVVQEGVVFNARAINSTASGAIKRQTMAETSCNT